MKYISLDPIWGSQIKANRIEKEAWVQWNWNTKTEKSQPGGHWEIRGQDCWAYWDSTVSGRHYKETGKLKVKMHLIYFIFKSSSERSNTYLTSQEAH